MQTGILLVSYLKIVLRYYHDQMSWYIDLGVYIAVNYELCKLFGYLASVELPGTIQLAH